MSAAGGSPASAGDQVGERERTDKQPAIHRLLVGPFAFAHQTALRAVRQPLNPSD